LIAGGALATATIEIQIQADRIQLSAPVFPGTGPDPARRREAERPWIPIKMRLATKGAARELRVVESMP
jgi:hypothetical protein